jgi:hypothetical protein
MATSNGLCKFSLPQAKSASVFDMPQQRRYHWSCLVSFGGGEMAGQRTFPQTPVVHSVIDPELDMRRSTQPPAGTIARLRQSLRKLLSEGRMRSPMRSIARELEESWPAGES